MIRKSKTTAQTPTSHRVFVYGTLKKGYRNNVLLSRSTFVAPATTNPEFRLYDNGSYPCLVKAKDGEVAHEVIGEVWIVDDHTLSRLDQLENAPDLYHREEIELIDQEKAWAYIYNYDTSRFHECGNQWPEAKVMAKN